MSEHHDHRDDCPFKFATLDVCDCVEKNMLDRIKALEAKLAKAEDMMRSLAAMIQHAIGPSKDVFIEPDTGRKLSDAYAIIAEIEGESHE